MITLPFVFKDQLMEKSLDAINEKVDAQVDVQDVRVSMFKRFPNLNVGLRGLSVSGKGQFEGDTLVQFESFDAEVDLMSLFKKQMVLEGVYLVQPRVHAKIAADSTVNWDIMKAPEEEVEEEAPDTAAAPTGYRVDLQTFQISRGKVLFEDLTSNMLFSADGLSFLMNGDLGADSSEISLEMHVSPVDFKMGAIRYIKEAKVDFNAGIGANIQDGRYHIRNNRFAINGLELNFDGLVTMNDAGRITPDISFATSKTSFKSLLSMVPAIYMQDFQELETAGELTLNGRVSGYYQDEVLPSVDVNLQVTDAMFSYPDLPKKAENIQISLQTFFDGKQPDNTRVDLEQFHIELAQNPFDATLSLRTPVSNPTIDGSMKGQVVLENLSDVIPMEETQLRGVVDSDLKFAGSMDMVEEERYNEFQAEGRVILEDFYFSSPELPEAVTMNSQMEFTPQYLDLKNLSARIGESDMNFSGKVSNYLAYALDQGVLKGDFRLTSDYLDVNRFLTDEQEEAAADTTAPAELSLFEVPSRIDFKMDAQMKEILYGDMQISDARGTILIKEQTVYLDDFGMGLFDGQMTASGEYSTRDTIRPYASFDMSVKDLQIKNALQTFRVMDSLAPILKRAEGDISLDLQYMSELQQNMMPNMKTIDGFGELRSRQIRMKGSRSVGKLLSALKITESASERFENVRVNFVIRQGKLIVKPFDVSLAGINMNISGSQSYDKTMDYNIDMKIPRSKFGAAANQLVQNLVDKAATQGVDIDPGENVNMKAQVTGTFSEPRISLNMGESSGSSGVKEQVKQKVQDIVEEKKEQTEEKVRKEASAKAQQIIREAEERADRIMAEAQKAAEKLRQEADKRASQIEKEAEGKNIIVRKAAEKSAEKVRQEADKKAEQLIQEARNQADSILEKAKKQADQIENK
jgi:uncharacterized protein involved in outer membrane biogenesis